MIRKQKELIVIYGVLAIFWIGLIFLAIAEPAYGEVVILTNGQGCNFTDYRGTTDQLIINCESSLTDSEYIDALYRQILEREPDPAGKSAWMINLSFQTRREVITAFIDSPEYRALCGC